MTLFQAFGQFAGAGVSAPTDGLVLVTSQSVTTAASVQIEGCFSATYDNYLLIVRALSSTGSGWNLQWVAGSTPNTGGTSYSRIQANYDTNFAVGVANVSYANFAGVGNIRTTPIVLKIFRPFAAVKTTTITQTFDPQNTRGFVYASSHDQTTSYDGIKITASSGTLTGEFYIYGYAK